ncbi:MAG TPA: hypothetical protein PLA12_00865 [Candidatus Hydrogenedens sp.]|nr:hypothetical protein [Candidatus Hydrogenedens sp.]
MRTLPIFFVCFTPLCTAILHAEEWNFHISKQLKDKTPTAIALEDLIAESKKYNISLSILSEGKIQQGKNTMIVVNKTEKELLKNLPKEFKDKLSEDIPEEGFVIQTLCQSDNSKIVVLVGGSEIGTAHGLYWILDRLQVNRTIPEINTQRAPAFPVRIAGSWGRNLHGGATEQQIKTSFRYGFNWVSGMNTLDLVPWNSEPEKKNNQEHIKKIKPLMDLAHSLGMHYFAFSNELTYHPSLFDNNPELLNPCLSEFWERVKEKYRLLFTALPDLDGIEICLDDISGFWDNYHPFDILHDCPDCPMSYEERYRLLLKNIHEVVVGEFNKTYFQKNWGLREYEIHCQPEVFKKVFTDEIPTNNLFVKIKVTRADRWWFQPYNRTFNLSPHRTIVIFEPMNYYEGSDTHLFPTFSGEYFQNGLKYFLSADNTNVSGLSYLGGISANEWSTRSAYVYTLYRLTWEPNVDIRQVAHDYCAINLGPELAEPMADILMDTANAYKYGLFLEPIAYGQFNSFPHMRVGTFVAEGYPLIDLGKGHIQFLKNIYLQCLPWCEFTKTQLNFGLSKAKNMLEKFNNIKNKIKSEELSNKLELQLNMTLSLINTHFDYMETAFNFFDYLENSSVEKKNSLQNALLKLINSRETFRNIPGFNYKLDGVNVLIEHAQRAVKDLQAEKKLLEAVPSQKEIDQIIQEQQEKYKEIFKQYQGIMKRLGHFEILIDGQDLLHIQGNEYRIEHLRWDGPEVVSAQLFSPLPQKEVIVIPMDMDTRPLHPFVLYQPSASNNYQTSIYLDDRPGGTGRFVFDLYLLEPDGKDLPIIKNWSEYFVK